MPASTHKHKAQSRPTFCILVRRLFYKMVDPSFIWRWCLRAIWKISNVLTAVTSDVTNNIEVGMIIQLSFNHSFKIVKIDKDTNIDATSVSTLGTVMIAVYRKWSFKERSLSKETPLRITKDKLPVIHPMKNCESLNLQYALAWVSGVSGEKGKMEAKKEERWSPLP